MSAKRPNGRRGARARGADAAPPETQPISDGDEVVLGQATTAATESADGKSTGRKRSKRTEKRGKTGRPRTQADQLGRKSGPKESTRPKKRPTPKARSGPATPTEGLENGGQEGSDPAGGPIGPIGPIGPQKNEDRRLSPGHQALIDASGIAPEVAAERGYRTILQRSELERLGFSKPQRIVPCLLVPVRDVHGELATYQIRPDEPRVSKDKALKYESPKGSSMVLDVPTRARTSLGDPKVPLWITEGARKVDAAVTQGLCCIGLLGVWNWRGTNAQGGKTALADWELITLKGRTVYLAFDSDVATKSAVFHAMTRLKRFLESRGAQVLVVYLPDGERGQKVGLDDFLASGRSTDDLVGLAEKELRRPPKEEGAALARVELPYTEERGVAILRVKFIGDVPVPTPMTNFSARIVEDITYDDGGETKRAYRIEAVQGHQVVEVDVPADQFASMRWASEKLGPKWIVLAGEGTRDNTRAAIQDLSESPKTRTIYQHTGWRQIDGQWCYLHAGGALGANGSVDGVEVQLQAAMKGYSIPVPSRDEQLVADVRAVLGLLDLDQVPVSMAMLGATFLAPLGDTDFSLHLSGKTGVQKSEMAALWLQFFGPEMNARGLPAHWSSTDNFLEELAFKAKDVLLVIDDFVPPPNKVDAQKLHLKADRVLRGQGNRSGRGRMRADTSLAEPRPPRGMVVSTGEDVPAGHSLRARLVVLEMGPEKMDSQKLAKCQAHAANGVYARVMAAYLVHVAANYERVQEWRKKRFLELRDELLAAAAHARAPSNFAQLQVGFELFLIFAIRSNAIDEMEAQQLRATFGVARQELLVDQRELQSQAEPVDLFFDLLRSAISAGDAHVASPDGGVPVGWNAAGAFGWRASEPGSTAGAGLVSKGKRVGWVEGNHLYLDIHAALAATQQVASDTERVAISPSTLAKRLDQRGLLVSKEGTRGKLTVRRTIEGGRRTVHHLHTDLLLGNAPSSPAGAQSAQSAQTPSEEALEGVWEAKAWAESGSGAVETGPDFRPTPVPGAADGDKEVDF